MTSVPKPLKFLLSYIDKISDMAETFNEDDQCKLQMHDLLSVLNMCSNENKRLCLLNALKAKNPENITQWGHEYLKVLAGEIGEEWSERALKKGSEFDDLTLLIDNIIPY